MILKIQLRKTSVPQYKPPTLEEAAKNQALHKWLKAYLSKYNGVGASSGAAPLQRVAPVKAPPQKFKLKFRR